MNTHRALKMKIQIAVTLPNGTVVKSISYTGEQATKVRDLIGAAALDELLVLSFTKEGAVEGYRTVVKIPGPVLRTCMFEIIEIQD